MAELSGLDLVWQESVCRSDWTLFPPPSPEDGQASVWLSGSRQAGSLRGGLALPTMTSLNAWLSAGHVVSTQ